jgi:hypothetical protein
VPVPRATGSRNLRGNGLKGNPARDSFIGAGGEDPPGKWQSRQNREAPMGRTHSSVGTGVGCLFVAAVLFLGLSLLVRGLSAITGPAPGPIDLAAWGKLSEGMPKAQVRSLLGKPVDQVLYVPPPGKHSGKYIRNYANHYQYVVGGGAAWLPPWCWTPHPKAYVVDFDENDTVISWSTPADRPPVP